MIVPNNNEIKKSYLLMMSSSFGVVLVLVAVMFFSPFSVQYYEDVSLSCNDAIEIDDLIELKEYKRALKRVDSLIAVNRTGLGRIAYFDRFLSAEEFNMATYHRYEIYDLQWKRIEILRDSGDTKDLKQTLKTYVGFVGYHQIEATELLDQLNKVK